MAAIKFSFKPNSVKLIGKGGTFGIFSTETDFATFDSQVVHILHHAGEARWLTRSIISVNEKPGEIPIYQIKKESQTVAGENLGKLGPYWVYSGASTAPKWLEYPNWTSYPRISP